MSGKDLFDLCAITIQSSCDHADLIERDAVLLGEEQDLLGHRADLVVNAKGIDDPAMPIGRQCAVLSMSVLIENSETLRQLSRMVAIQQKILCLLASDLTLDVPGVKPPSEVPTFMRRLCL